jgi:transposase
MLYLEKIQTCVNENDIARLLMTIPGIGYCYALLIVSEIGDINRFPDSYHLCSYAGLVPSTHSSGGITYHGSITKTGSKYLRWVMIENVSVHILEIIRILVSQNFMRDLLKEEVKVVLKQLLLLHQNY